MLAGDAHLLFNSAYYRAVLQGEHHLVEPAVLGAPRWRSLIVHRAGGGGGGGGPAAHAQQVGPVVPPSNTSRGLMGAGCWHQLQGIGPLFSEKYFTNF